jgi:multisubunit Na+/H+ antiporter MnhF subunit
VNEWEILAAALIAALVPCLGVALRCGIADALVALEIAGTLTSTALMALAEGLQRQPFVDLALVLAFLSIAGTLALARLIERDL